MSVVGRIILRKIFVENDRDSVTETDISFLNKNVKISFGIYIQVFGQTPFHSQKTIFINLLSKYFGFRIIFFSFSYSAFRIITLD
jgi:hypothetical protein